MITTISDEAAAKAMSAAASIPPRVLGRHITAQNAVGKQVPGGGHPAVGHLDRRERQQDQGGPQHGPQPGRPDVPLTGVVREQRADGRDEGPGSRVDPRGVPQLQQRDDLPEDARHQLQVAAKGGEQVPRMRERSDEEDAVVLGIDQVPGRNVSDAALASPPWRQGRRGSRCRPAPAVRAGEPKRKGGTGGATGKSVPSAARNGPAGRPPAGSLWRADRSALETT